MSMMATVEQSKLLAKLWERRAAAMVAVEEIDSDITAIQEGKSPKHGRVGRPAKAAEEKRKPGRPSNKRPGHKAETDGTPRRGPGRPKKSNQTSTTAPVPTTEEVPTETPVETAETAETAETPETAVTQESVASTVPQPEVEKSASLKTLICQALTEKPRNLQGLAEYAVQNGFQSINLDPNLKGQEKIDGYKRFVQSVRVNLHGLMNDNNVEKETETKIYNLVKAA